MRNTKRAIAAGLLLVAGAIVPAAADEVADFYKGKSVNIVVGHEPATGFDVYARVLARHLGRHIPGNPNIVVQNMAGASGLTAANWLYNVAPKDGTVMATFVHTIPFEPLMGNNAARFEPAKFAWIGNMEESVAVLRHLQGAGIAKFEDMLKQGDHLGRDRRDRTAGEVGGGGQEPARRQDEDRVRLQGLGQRQDRDHPQRGRRHLRTADVDHHVGVGRRLQFRRLPAGDPALRPQAGGPQGRPACRRLRQDRKATGRPTA